MLHRTGYNNKGQAVAEMAVFGSLILFVFGIMLSYLQRQNDQQYVQMEGFRRAQSLACSYIDPGSEEGQGARVQMTLIENRRHADLSGDYKKGSAQTLSASSNVFWAVPPLTEGAEVPNLIAYRINQDEIVRNQREFISREHDSRDEEGNERQRYWSFETEDISTDTKVEFNERIEKQEDAAGITNTASSELKESIRVVIPYTINERDKDNEEYKQEVSSGTFWEVEQNLYRDASDGQYKYSSQAPDEPIKRGKLWKTGF